MALWATSWPSRCFSSLETTDLKKAETNETHMWVTSCEITCEITSGHAPHHLHSDNSVRGRIFLGSSNSTRTDPNGPEPTACFSHSSPPGNMPLRKDGNLVIAWELRTQEDVSRCVTCVSKRIVVTVSTLYHSRPISLHNTVISGVHLCFGRSKCPSFYPHF